MEIQVMILDDEYIILDGLCSFPWEEYGCKVAATAKNGIEGIEKFRNTKVDLIFSDVKMPGMDGLEFSAKARELNPDVTIVILTGYDSFTYAKQAIRIGVEEYLLKPIDYDLLKETVERLAGEIREKRGKQQYFQDLQRYFNNSLPQFRTKFVSDLLQGRIQGKEEMKAQQDSLQLCIEKYIVCVGRKLKQSGRMDKCDMWIEEFAYVNIFEEIFDSYGIRVLSEYNTSTMEYNFILLFEKEEDNKSCMERAQNACSRIQQEVGRYCSVYMNFGLSDVEEEAYRASSQYRKAQKACQQCVYLGTNIILKYEDLHYEGQKEFVITTGEKSRFMMSLFQGNYENIEQELQQMFDAAKGDLAGLKFASMDLLISCMKFPYTCAVDSDIQNKNWNVSVLQDGVKRISDCKTEEEVIACLLQNFSILIRQNTESADERNKKLVRSIQLYIEKNYANDLSMDDLTEAFHVSRTYISRLLKKYSGKSFIEYLTDVRFGHAEQLINENKYKQYEIAEMVGYKDFGYYIKVFKKRYGITPNEFRKHM